MTPGKFIATYEQVEAGTRTAKGSGGPDADVWPDASGLVGGKCGVPGGSETHMKTARNKPAVGRKGQGHFFAIDRRCWAHACKTDINAMVAYLVLARGTGHDQESTSWSVHAVEGYTGISRPRAQSAIGVLVAAGLLQVIKGGTRPRYRIVRAYQVPGCEGFPHPRLRAKASDAPTAKPGWIWLPNALIDGVAGEVAPVEMVRQTQSLPTLQLLVSLYHAQALASDGGIHWRRIRQDFRREIVWEWGAYVIYGFEPAKMFAWQDAPFVNQHMTGKTDPTSGHDAGWPVFWAAWKQLVRFGLVAFVNHLVEADNDTADIIHPYAVDNGEEAERSVAEAAHSAAERMLPELRLRKADDKGLLLAPILAHFREVQMVGVARLRYRARTAATSEWYGRMSEWAAVEARYKEIEAEMDRRNAAVLAEANSGLQHQRNSM
jgi:hypothetical protein